MIENTNLELKLVEIRDNQYMSDLYPDGLPSNAIIDKTLTAKGATTCELDERYAKRIRPVRLLFFPPRFQH